MKKKLLFLSFLICVFFVSNVYAQKRTITGKVTSFEDGSTLPGVNVVIKGTSNGTVTDIDGNYQLLVSNDAKVLVFSFIGLESKEIEIGSRSTIDISMNPDTKQLSEVVVLGYGNVDKDRLTSAVSVVDGSEIESFNATRSIDQILQGKASGVSIVAGNGRPGQTALVNIRGIATTGGGMDPLYIVDGVPVDPSNINNIHPSDIQNISILKDAATSALYGSRAGNGVILITTKTGRKGKPEITLRASFGNSSRLKDNFDIMTAQQKLEFESSLMDLGIPSANNVPGGKYDPSKWSPYIARETDWIDELTGDGPISNLSLSIKGGGDKNTYFLSMNKDDDKGIIRELNGLGRYSARLNMTQKVREYLKIGTNFSIAHSKSDLPRDRNNAQNPFYAMYTYAPYVSVFKEDNDGNLILDANGNPEYDVAGVRGFSISEALITNPEDIFNLVTIGSVYAEASFSKKITNKFTIGISNDRYTRNTFTAPGSVLDGYVGDKNAPGNRTDNGSNDYRITATNVLSYTNTFASVHNVRGTFLYEYNRGRFSRYRFETKGFVTDRLSAPEIAAAASSTPTGLSRENVLASFGGAFNYSYDEKYSADFTIRRDGSSKFGMDNRWGNFYALSAGWNVHNENFFTIDFINSLRVRSSLGTSGNNNLKDFSSLSLIEFGSRNGQSTVIPKGVADSKIHWEAHRIFDVGIEANVWNNKITFVTDFFKRVSSELLGDKPLSQTVGDEDNSLETNVGEIQTQGFEFELSADVYDAGDWLITVGGNISFLKTNVNKLSNGEDIRSDYYTILREKEEINSFFMNRYAGVDSLSGAPLWFNKEGEITKTFEGSDAVLLDGKSPQAKYQGGFFLSAKWKGFDLRADGVFRGGNYIYNRQASALLNDGSDLKNNQMTDAFNFWKKPGDVGVYPSPLFGQESSRTSDRFLQKGNYVRLRNLTVGYSLPPDLLKKGGIKFVRVFFQGQNLLTYIPFYQGDPEVGIGSGETVEPGESDFVIGEFSSFSYPNTRILTAGIEIKF